MWAVLTRLEEPKNAGLTLLQKLKLYNGKTLPGFTEDNIKELTRGGRARGHARHQPALRPGQDLQRPGRPPRRATRSTRSWCCNELETGLQAPLADQQRGDAQALPAAALGREGGVRGHREERSAARHRRRRGRPHAALRATTSTTSRPTRSAKRSRTSTPARPRSRTNG